MGHPPDHITTADQAKAPTRRGFTSPMPRHPASTKSNSSGGRVSTHDRTRSTDASAAVQRSGDRPDAKPACGTPRAGRSAAASVPSTDHHGIHRCLGIRFHATEQQRGSDLAARSNAVSGVTRVPPSSGLATDDKRGPFGFSRWGRGKRFGEASERSEARGSPRSDRSSILSSFFRRQAQQRQHFFRRQAHRVSVKSSISPPTHLPSRLESGRAGVKKPRRGAALRPRRCAYGLCRRLASQ
jgi:hypothetical protein